MCFDLLLLNRKYVVTLNNLDMNSDQVEGKWKQIKGQFKQKYGKLTDDDVTYSEGKFDEMLGNLQEKTGKTKEQLKDEIDRM